MTEPIKNEPAQRLGPRPSPLLRVLYPLGSVLLLVSLWQILYIALKLPAFILPSPKLG